MMKFVGQPVATFTGRGAFSQTLKEARARQSEARAEMVTLVERSKVAGCPLYLQVHVRPNATRELRWRYRNGQHVLWEAAQGQLATLPLAIQKHCESLNKRSRELFAMDAMCEHVAKWCASVLEQKAMRKRSPVAPNTTVSAAKW